MSRAERVGIAELTAEAHGKPADVDPDVAGRMPSASPFLDKAPARRAVILRDVALAAPGRSTQARFFVPDDPIFQLVIIGYGFRLNMVPKSAGRGIGSHRNSSRLPRAVNTGRRAYSPPTFTQLYPPG